MSIFSSADRIIGSTPLLQLNNIKNSLGLKADILAKLEFFNPAGSAKDRVAKAMIDDAEKNGSLTAESVIIEPTSGNTGIGLASVAAARGYRCIIVMPDNMSAERIGLMKAYGAEVILTDGRLAMAGAIEKAEQLAHDITGGIIMGQFVNPANPLSHFLSTGPEIFDDTNGAIDIFIATVGTGGTISGVGGFLKSKMPNIKVIAVEPEGSPFLSQGKAGPHKIQGIGAGFIPKVLDMNVLDGVMTVSDSDAFDTARLIGKTEGVLVGISSGAAAFAAIELAKKEENLGKRIVTIFPDSGDRYLSSGLYDI